MQGWPINIHPAHPATFKQIMLRMIGLWQEGDLLSKLEANHLASAISILKEIPVFQIQKYQKPQSLNWITSYFSFHLSEPITLDDMAKRAQLSPSRFSAVFRNHFGMPPHQYLLHLRIA
jgi:AraC-like DNA-binding protein